ncbi:MAG: SUF system NifU family Fe-S cluster assembly protein [Actinobacteria bacterium]|nr:SUF system NifU family Fe-S cluster assembly protein [Actinomycetota bacterium]
MSRLEDLYKEVILDHYRNPRCRGELPVPPATMAEGFNPLCGDEITVYVEVEDDRLARIRIAGRGCSISSSSASMMAETLEGCSLAEVGERIAMFNTLMSVHEASLDHDGLDADGLPADDGAPMVDDDALGDLVALRGVLRYPRRIKCATLGWTTLTKALAEAN